MSSLGGPNIITDGLVLYLDAANNKSLADVPATNLFKNSQAFTSSSWGKSNTTVVDSTTPAPYIGTLASTLTATGAFTQLNQTVTVSAGVYTVSYYVKYINQRYITIVHEGTPYGLTTFDLINGTKGGIGGTAGFVIGSSITPVDNGFYRISLTFNIAQSNFNLVPVLWFGGYNATNNSGSQVYVWGAQLETGPTATTYIPTTFSIASRVPSWSDVSRRGNTGTLINGVAYDSSNGGSLVFDGVDDYVRVPSIVNTTFPQDTGTISIWYNIDSTGQTATLPSIFDSYDSRNHIFIRRSSNPLYAIQVAFQDVSVAYRYVYSHLLTLDVWHNIVVTYITGTNSSGRVYIDGVLVNSGTISDSAWRPTQQFVGIGSIYATNTAKGKGNILQIYNRALSAQEVLQNYNATKSRFNL